MGIEENFWQCSRCGRTFPHVNQAHSCVTYNISRYFVDKPENLKQTFNYLVQKVGEFGPVRVDAVQTAISLGARSHFAMIYPLKNSLNLELWSNKPIDSRRVFKKQMISPGNYLSHIKLVNQTDVDSELLSWLRQAYFLKS